MIFQKNGDELITSLAVRNNMDIDKVISAYLITGDQLLMLLHIFEGQTLTIPSKRRLGCANLHNVLFIEDDKQLYKDYEKKQILEYKGEEYVVVNKERKILNHYYLPVIKEETLEEEEIDEQ